MALVPVEQLKPGMEVAEDVSNVNGMLLLASGTLLSDKTIRVLKMWGVEMLRVVGGEEPDSSAVELSQLDPEVLIEVEREMALRFKHVGDDMHVTRAVKKLAYQRTAKRVARQRDARQREARP